METQEIMRYATSAAYLYTGLFLLLGTLGLPIPEEVITLLVGYLAAIGVVNIWLIAPYTIAVIILLDNLIYYSARKLGRGFVKKWGRFILLSQKRLRKLEGYFDRHGNKTVFFSRFLLGFRSTGMILAGITKMPWKSFLLWDTLSILVFVSLTMAIGYIFQQQLNQVLRDFSVVKNVIFFGVLSLIFIWLIKHLISHYTTEDEKQ